MDKQWATLFADRWEKHFGVGLPIGYFYTDRVQEEDLASTDNRSRCLIGNLSRVRDGFAFVYDAETPGCAGGKRFAGFSKTLGPNFEYFLSCGIPGEVEGERYKKSPALVRAYEQANPPFDAPARYLVFKRWDKLLEDEEPLAVIFFGAPDVLAGLFTLANYDRDDPFGVITPMGSGCSSIVSYPLSEARSSRPRGVLGMFDVSARPCVPANELTLTIPTKRLEEMAANMDESFLITHSWSRVRARV